MAKKITLKKFAESLNTDGIAAVQLDSVEEHVAAGHITVNPKANANGTHDAALTDAGKVALGGTGKAAPAEKPQFEIMSGLVPPPALRGGVREESYPFGQLEVGQSFFVPATEKNPNPAKTFASTVSSATRRFATKTDQTRVNRKGKTVPVLALTRKFTIRGVVKGQKYDNGFVETAAGARVFRVA